MARYNQWMNQKLYTVCAEIPDADRKKDMGAFFESIHGTLDHLLWGDKAWMARFADQPFPAVGIGEELYSDFDTLRREREKMDEEIIAWTKTLSSEWFDSMFAFVSKSDGKHHELPTWSAVTHMFNHQTHHRGQLTTLINQLGYKPGVTDIPWMPEFNQ